MQGSRLIFRTESQRTSEVDTDDAEDDGSKSSKSLPSHRSLTRRVSIVSWSRGGKEGVHKEFNGTVVQYGG